MLVMLEPDYKTSRPEQTYTSAMVGNQPSGWRRRSPVSLPSSKSTIYYGNSPQWRTKWNILHSLLQKQRRRWHWSEPSQLGKCKVFFISQFKTKEVRRRGGRGGGDVFDV